MPHSRGYDAKKLSNRASAAPASGKSSFLPTISPGPDHMSFSDLNAVNAGNNSFLSQNVTANQASKLLPSQFLPRPALPLPLSQQPGARSMVQRKPTNVQISQKEYIDLNLDNGNQVFKDYIQN